MAGLTLSLSHFNVIRRNQKALLKELKAGWNTHFRQCKNVKTDFFSGTVPLKPKSRQRGLQHHPIWHPKRLAAPPGKHANFTHYFLIYMFTPRKTGDSIILSYFDPWYGIPNKIKWKLHCINTLYLKFRRYFLQKFIICSHQLLYLTYILF